MAGPDWIQNRVEGLPQLWGCAVVDMQGLRTTVCSGLNTHRLQPLSWSNIVQVHLMV